MTFSVPDIPSPYSNTLWGPTAITSADGNGAYLQNDDHFFELNCSITECSWNLMDQKLKNGRSGTILMYLPPSFKCKKES